MRSLLVALLLIGCTASPAAEPPPAALQYKGLLVRQARLSWGLSAPVAVMAAQVHQESGWRPDARSPYAHGLAQFTPATAEWIGGMDSALAGADTGNPAWALRALATYDRWLHDRVPEQADTCLRWDQLLRAYNGGLGWVKKEARTGQPCSAFRSEANCKENLGYPRNILYRWQPLYQSWGLGVQCQ